MHFGTIFAEQLLCKVGRWKKRMMKSMGKKDLSVMARPLFEGKPWTPGENWDDHTKWPIPSAQDFPLSVFKSIVEDGFVAILFSILVFPSSLRLIGGQNLT